MKKLGVPKEILETGIWPNTTELMVIPKELMAVSRTYNPSTQAILLAIYTFYEEFKEAMPIQDTILAEVYDIASSTIRRSLKILKDEGFVEVSRAGGIRRAKPNFNYPWKFWEQLQETWKIIRGEQKVVNTIQYDSIAIKMIEYWNSKGGLRPIAIPLNHGNGYYERTEMFSKLEGRLKSLISGKLFNNIKSLRFWHSKPWTLEEVKVSIDNFHKAATNVEYEPFIKTAFQRLRMIEFLSNPFMKSYPQPIIYFQDEPKYARIRSEEIIFPGLYSSVKEEMQTVFTKGIELSPKENMQIIIGSNRCGELAKTKYQKFLRTNLTSTMWAGYIVEALLKILRRDTKTFSVFSTIIQPWFWESAFPQFLVKKGILSEYTQKK